MSSKCATSARSSRRCRGCAKRMRTRSTTGMSSAGSCASPGRLPGAFARYRYREDLFPSVTFRRAYDRLLVTHGDRADIEYLRILRLAAKVGEGPCLLY